MHPLAGQRIALTRSRDDSALWAERLAALGIEPIIYPCIRVEFTDSPTLAADLSAAVANADWLVFTSRRGVEAAVRHDGFAVPARTRIAVVGESTAAKARETIGRADVIGGGTAAALGHELTVNPSFTKGCRCVIALAANASTELEEILRRAGATCQRFDVYRTIANEPREPKQPLSDIDPDALVFASPTAVVGFTNQVAIDVDRPAFTIGPSTSRALRAHGLDVTGEARKPSFNGILETIVEAAHA